MRPLPVSIKHHPGEPAFSFASRLAAAMGVPSLRDFCRHMVVPYDALLRGNAEPIDRLAALGGVDPTELRKHSLIRLDGYSEINGQKVSKKDVRLGGLWGCPACLTNDLEQGDGLMASRPYLRSSWLLRLTRACPLHRLPLVELGAGVDPSASRDIGVIARHCRTLIADQATGCHALPASDLADYVHDRLFGREGPSFLDGLPFYVAVRLTEMVGAAATIGLRFDHWNLSDEDWWKAGRAGFAVAREGEEGLRAFLSSRLESFWETHRFAGGRTLLGTLYSWLRVRTDDPDFAAVCALVRDHVAETLPLGPGDDFLGPITSRRWHSVHSAAKEYSIHPKRLRKQLAAEGFIKPGHERLTDDRTLFEAEPAAPFLTNLARSMSAEEASDYGGIPRTAWELLVAHGFIRPVAPASGGGGSYAVFARAEIDGLLGRMMRSAVPMKASRAWPLPKHELTSIQSAAKKAKCSIIEIVRLLIEGQLGNVGIKEGAKEFRAIMVDVDEVRRRMVRPGLKGLSLREVERRLGTTTVTVKSLIDGEHLEAVTEINPVSRCPQTVVMPDVLLAFMENYVSLSRLSRERRMQIAVLKRELDEAGIEPAFDLGEKAARFFSRIQIAGSR